MEQRYREELDKAEKALENMKGKLVESRKQVRNMLNKDMQLIQAHQKLMFGLYKLSMDDDDPEMNQSMIDEALDTFFSVIGYPDIPTLIRSVKTY